MTTPAPSTQPTDGGPTFRFEAELWESALDGATWVFVTLPTDEADEIADLAPPRRGFGSVRVEVTVGATSWRTSLFPDTKVGSYILPVKRAVRTAEDLDVGVSAIFELAVVVDRG